MKVLVTGAAGMLGSSLVPELVRAGHDVTATDLNVGVLGGWKGVELVRAVLDVRSPDDVEEGFAIRPEMVLHLAAETDLEVCETDPDGAYETNALGTKFVALASQRHGVPMVYISTAGVFDGTKEAPYTEFDDPNPINVYGRSKFEGERYVQWLLDRFYIVRAGWMVGGGVVDHKFVGHIVAQLSEGRRTVHAVSDKLGTPTYAPDFSRGLCRLIGSGSYGLYHMASVGSASRFDVARHILDVLGRDDVELVEVGSEFFHERFFAPRPRSEVMRNLVLDLQGMNVMRPWEDSIADYLHENFSDAPVWAEMALPA